MNLETWLPFVLACIVISATPGAGVVNTISNAMLYAVKHSLPPILGLQAGLVALLPQFLDLESPHTAQFSVMGLTLLSIDIIVMLGYAVLANTIAQWIKSDSTQRKINKLFGGMFMLAAGLMASYQRT